MSHYHYHCVSSAKAFGGVAEDYAKLHAWMDRSRAGTDKLLHRMLAHHTQGIADGVALFGDTWEISTGARIPTSLILNRHVREDLGFMPTLEHYLELLHCPRWASRPARLLFSKLLPDEQLPEASPL